MSEIPTLVDIEDDASLHAFLQRCGLVRPDEPVRSRVLAGGVSNKTVWVRAGARAPWVLKQALPKLRVAVDWFSSPARVHQEALGLRHAAALLPARRIPDLVLEDVESHVLAMAAVPEPHTNWRDTLLCGGLNLAHVQQFGDTLGCMHEGAWSRRSELRAIFNEYAFFESLRLEPYYEYTASQLAEASPFLHRLAADTRIRRITLVHGDYSPKNVLLHGDEFVLLDFEVSHWGDPGFDVGFAAAHFLSKANARPHERSQFGEAARHFWRAYRARLDGMPWTQNLERFSIQHTVACLLARVAGRSPVPYLDAGAAAAQRDAAISLMKKTPTRWEALVDEFLAALPPP